jgi:K+-transporting ATPase ATPase C chain
MLLLHYSSKKQSFMKNIFFQSVKLTAACLVLFSGIYTLLIFGVAQAAPNNGKGEIVTANGKTYYANIGQSFTANRYFNSRPSAVGYNAAGSGGSNKGPSNPEYLAEVQKRIDTLLILNPGVKRGDIPADLVTASGSGLDPHISVLAAKMQIKRIAKARNLNPAQLNKINVLELNIALDKLR